jgi:DNA-binding IclR family transcriptional regulator
MSITSPDGRSGPQTRPLSSATKTLALLDAIAASTVPVHVSQLASDTGMPRAAVHQQLVTLAAAGWVEQLDDRRYRLTLRPARIAQAAWEQGGLGSRVLPTMDSLVAELNEAVSLAILDNGAAHIIERAEPGRPVRVDLRHEARMPIERSGSGLVLVAFATEHERRRLHELGVFVPESVLEEVRRRRWAASSEDWPDGVRAVAAPIIDAHGRCVAALSVAAPPERWEPSRFAEALLEACDRLHRELGGQGQALHVVG